MTATHIGRRTRAFMLVGAGIGALAMGSTPAFAQSSTASSAAAESEPQSSANPSAAQSSNSPTTVAQQAQGPVEGPGTAAAAAPPGQDIVVTGVRASVGSALQLQRTATSLQQSIVAEDIGKLPDNNVVEALQHVEGISIIRNSVEPGTVLIRGLPDIATTLNGRQLFSSSGRFVSLPDLPAELLARVDVKKAPSADDLEGGIAGLIDVSLHRPFDFRKPQLAASIKGTYGSLSKKWAPTGSFLASDRWDTGIGEIGALIDLSYQKREVSTDRITQNQSTLRRVVAGAGTGPAGDVSQGEATVAAGSLATPNTTTFTQADTEIVRSALNASLQWRPSPSLEFFSDFFYTRLRNQAPVDVNLILYGTCPNAAATVAFPGTNVAQTLPSSCYGLTSMQDRRTQEDTYQSATGFTWDANENLTVKVQGNYTHSKDNTVSFIPDAQFNYGPGGATAIINPDNAGGVTLNFPGDPQLNPNNAFIDQWYDTRNPRSGHEWAGRIDASYKISPDSFFRSVDVGYRFNTRSALSDSANTGLNCALTTGDGANPYNKFRLAALNSQACLAYRNGATPQPFSQATPFSQTGVGGLSYASFGSDAYHVTKGSFFDGAYGVSSWVNMDPDWVWNNAESIRNKFGYSGPLDLVPTNHFGVTEKSNAGYIKINYSTDLGAEMTIDGNFGVRVIQTKLTENAFTQRYVPIDTRINPATITAANPAGTPYTSTQGLNATCITCLVYTPIVGSKTDTQWLPSFNLRWKLINGLYFRGDASMTVTRPTFAQLNPGVTFSAATATLLGTASSGNANLNPVKSTNFDLDLTYYWGTANHIGASVFYRKVKGYIQTVQSTLTLEGFNYIYSQPQNFQDASIKGIEGGYSQFLDFLPGIFSGLGFDVNGTYIDAPFNNVAKYHVNSSGIYEKGPVSLRLSYTWNAPYRIAAFATGAQPQFTYASLRTNMDFSANYRFSDRLTVSFDATNLLNSYQREHAGDGALNEQLFPTALARYDRTYSFGLRLKL